MPRLEGIDLYLAGMRDHHKALTVARNAVAAKMVPPEDEAAVYLREIQYIIAQRAMRGEMPPAVPPSAAWPPHETLTGRPN